MQENVFIDEYPIVKRKYIHLTFLVLSSLFAACHYGFLFSFLQWYGREKRKF